MRLLPLLLCALACACTSRNRSPGAADFTTAVPFATPVPAHPLANLDPNHPAAPAAPAPPAPVPVSPAANSRPRLATGLHKVTARGVALTILAFDDRSCSLHVADKQRGPDTEWQSAQAAAASRQAIAAINAGFFTPEGEPLGLVIEDGARFGSWNRGSSLTSGLLAVVGDRPRLTRRAPWSPSTPAAHLVQAGPLLLEGGTIVSGLSTSPPRPRSFIAWDGRHHWMIGAAKSATLAGLAAALETQPVPSSRFTTAVNLDGGRSADLWVAPTIAGEPVSTRTLWNKPVRNYILVKERPATRENP